VLDVICFHDGMPSLMDSRREAMGQHTSEAQLDKYFKAQKPPEFDEEEAATSTPNSMLAPMAEVDEEVTAARRGRPTDWSLWRERSVLLALRLLDAALSNDGPFVEAVRTRLCCVLCAVCCVLYVVCCVLYVVCRVPCAVCYVLCAPTCVHAV